MSIRITCINKDNGNHENPHEAITHLGWTNESNNQNSKNTRLEIVKFIEDGNVAYVRDLLNHEVHLRVMTSRWGNKFVQTQADGRLTNNLLELLECR